MKVRMKQQRYVAIETHWKLAKTAHWFIGSWLSQLWFILLVIQQFSLNEKIPDQDANLYRNSLTVYQWSICQCLLGRSKSQQAYRSRSDSKCSLKFLDTCFEHRVIQFKSHIVNHNLRWPAGWDSLKQFNCFLNSIVNFDDAPLVIELFWKLKFRPLKKLGDIKKAGQ